MAPTAIIERKYGGRILKGTFYIKQDKNGNQDGSHAQITLYDLSQRQPLTWSYPVGVAEAHAALTIFEATGVTLQG